MSSLTLTLRNRRLVATTVLGTLAVPLCVFGPGVTAAAASTTCTPVSYTNCVRFGYTGADQTFTVPAGVTSLRLKLWGAGGANGLEAKGGGGGFTTGTLTVTPGPSRSTAR
ncbi:hypothetical protein ACFPIJ_59095 [Dactylosporangium cerinum]|uniref:Uncharacterized protein n=1 Tax=Dactylosporangium cerinum TaxID=1434730 RepID=A0ABV9WK90_9ACTN